MAMVGGYSVFKHGDAESFDLCNVLNKTITNVNITLPQRVAEESMKLGEQINTLNTKF